MMQNAEIRETLMIGASGVLPTPELVVSVESVLQRYYCVNTDVPFLFTLRNNSISKHYLQQSMYYAEIRLYTADGTEIQDVLQVKNDNPFPTATTQTSPHRRIPIQLDEHTTLTLKFNQIITNVFLKINVYLNQTGTENEAVLSSWQASAPVSITSMQLVLNDAFEGNYDDLEKRLFYNAKGGKDKAIRFEITIKDQHQQDVFLHDVEIKPILLYDDGKYTKVTNQEILKYEAGADNRVRLIHGRVDVRLRINQVSAKHLNHRFCVAFVPVTHTDIAPGYSAGIEVRSKLNTHQLQRKSSSQLEMMASSTSLHDSDDSSDSPPKKKRKSTSEAHQDITSPMTGNDIEVAQQVKQLQEDVKIMMNTMRLMYTQLSSMLEGNQGYPCPEMKRLIDDGFLAIHTKHDTIIQLFQNLQKCLHIDMNNNKSNDVIDAASALSQLSNQSRDINTLPPQHVASSSSSSSSSSPTSSSNILSTIFSQKHNPYVILLEAIVSLNQQYLGFPVLAYDHNLHTTDSTANWTVVGFFQGETFKAREEIVDIPIDDALIMHRLQAWMMKESGHEHFILITWSMNSFPFVQSQLLPYFQRNAQLGSTSFNLDRESQVSHLWKCSVVDKAGNILGYPAFSKQGQTLVLEGFYNFQSTNKIIEDTRAIKEKLSRSRVIRVVRTAHLKMLQEVTPESNISILAIAGDSTNLEYHLVSIPWEGLSASEVLPTSLVFKFVLNLDVNIKHELENMINSQDQGHVMGINCCDKMDLASSLFDNEPIPYKLSSSS